MWVFLNDAMLSIVAAKGRPRKLLVRARAAGDIERVFPKAHVRRTFPPGASDYPFRAFITRVQVGNAIARELKAIAYPNFKASVKERDRHDVYLAIWRILEIWQQRRLTAPRRHPQLVSSRELERITG